ncbi:hypothetical protein [Serratia fonticola]
MKLKKPRIKLDVFTKMFSCSSVEVLPGERCYIFGDGRTPAEAYKEWKLTAGYFLFGLATISEK